MTDNSIHINIWDDYFDDGYIPDGQIQETYAYVESDLEDAACQEVLTLLKDKITALANPAWNLNLEVNYYDSSKVYPNLVNTEHAYCLYKRWQLEIKHLTHEAREWLVDSLEGNELIYNNLPIVVYSES